MATDLTVGGDRPDGALWRWRPLAVVAEALAAEGDRRILWLPVFFGTGIAFYFTPTFEQPWWLGLAATIAAIIPAIVLRHRPELRNAALALAFCAAGLAIMQQARWDRGAPMLERRLGPVAITGRVIDVDLLERGWRVIIAPDPLPGLAPAEQPLRVQSTARFSTLRFIANFPQKPLSFWLVQ
jgi:competence protein ComEC